MNAIAFSLYGVGAIYTDGLIRNLEAVPAVYPDWKVLVFTDGAMGDKWIARCWELGAEVILEDARLDAGGRFWRFLPVGDPRFAAVVVRDADSCVSAREAAAVHEWLRSDQMFHAMHDSHHHWGGEWPMLAGMWGAKRGAFPVDFPHLVRWWLQNKGPFDAFADQWFLRRFVWPHFLRSGILHTSNVDSRYRGIPFPAHEEVAWHVGERLGCFDACL